MRKVWRNASLFVRLAGLLILQHYDLCYFAMTAKGVAFYRDAVLIMLLKLFRVRLVFHLHNKGVRSRQDQLVDNILYRCVFRRSTVILLSERLYSDISKYVKADRVHICPNGIPSGDYQDPLPLGRRPVEILFLSNLIEAKGVYVLIEACRILKEEGLEFRCTLAGGTGDITAAEISVRIQREGLDNFVKLRGSQYGNEKIARFREADIFVLPTFYHFECLPLVVLEAMRCGLPVVSTDEGGIPDLVLDGVTGYVCPRRNAPAVAEKLRLLICDESLRRKCGEAGWLHFKGRFTLELFEHRLTDILRSVVKPRSASEDL